jgi:hypothetical protein
MRPREGVAFPAEGRRNPTGRFVHTGLGPTGALEPTVGGLRRPRPVAGEFSRKTATRDYMKSVRDTYDACDGLRRAGTSRASTSSAYGSRIVRSETPTRRRGLGNVGAGGRANRLSVRRARPRNRAFALVTPPSGGRFGGLRLVVVSLIWVSPPVDRSSPANRSDAGHRR